MEASPRRAHPVLLRRDKRGGIRTDNRGLLFSLVALAIVSPAVFNEQPSLKSICQLRIRRRTLSPHTLLLPLPFQLCTRVAELAAQRWKCARVNTAYRCGMYPAGAASAARACTSWRPGAPALARTTPELQSWVYRTRSVTLDAWCLCGCSPAGWTFATVC